MCRTAFDSFCVGVSAMRAQAKSEQSDITTGPVLHAQQIAAKIDRMIENAAKSNELLRLVPTRTPTGASAVVRPVPGGEHKGMLKLVDFTQPGNGAVSRNADQSLTFRPKPGFTGKDSFDYTLRDEAGTMFSATVTVAVTLDAPAVKPAPVRAPSLRALGSVPAPRPAPTPAPTPARAGEGLPRRHGGPGLFPSE